MENKTKNAIIYCRVSTKEQCEGNSLDSQEEISREYLTRSGYSLFANPFIEEGESAKTANRPELIKMMNYCQKNKGKIDVLVIYKVNRFARNTNDYLALKIFFNNLSIAIESVTERLEDTPAGRFSETILAAQAQFDNEIRGEVSRNGSVKLVQSGMRNGKVPLGYVKVWVDKARFVQHDEPFASHILRGFELIKMGYQQEEARKQLLQEGFREKDGREVSPTHWEKILQNPFYKGILTDYGQNIKGDFVPIVPPTLYDEVRLILTNKKRKIPKYNMQNSYFPLRGLLLCKDGEKFSGSRSRGHLGGLYPNYSPRCKTCKYERGELNSGKIHSYFKAYLEKFEFDNELSEALKTAIQINWDKRHEQKIKIREQLENKLQTLTERKKILFEKNMNGIYSDELFKEQMALNELEYKTTKNQCNELNEVKEEIGDVIKFGLEFLKNISSFWEKSNVDIQQRFQNFFFPSGLTYFGGGRFGTHHFTLIFQLKQAFSEQKYPLVAPRGIEPLLPP